MLMSDAKVPRRGKTVTRFSSASRLIASRNGVRPSPSSRPSASSLIGAPGGMRSVTMRSRSAAYACSASGSPLPRLSRAVLIVSRLSPTMPRSDPEGRLIYENPRSVAQLGAPPRDELLELAAQRPVERRLLVALERRAPELGGARGRV